MGLQIGQSASLLGAQDARQPRRQAREPAPANSPASSTTPVNLAEQSARAVGQGNLEPLSVSAAALVTIGRTVLATREIVPSPQESAADLRERSVERRQEVTQRIEDQFGRPIERRIPEPSSEVREIADQANEAEVIIRERQASPEALERPTQAPERADSVAQDSAPSDDVDPPEQRATPRVDIRA